MRTTAATQEVEASDRFGICQWFHYGDHRQVEATVEALAELGVRHLRTGISWADWHRPEGRAWYDWQMRTLADAGLELLLCIWHTPPSISADPSRGSASVPPARVRDYADFVDHVIDLYGDAFHDLELWNEPNNPYKWEFEYDPDYGLFAEMVRSAGHWAGARGKRRTLGGVTLLDNEFVERMHRLDVFDQVDILGIHAFPGMWEPFATDWDRPEHWYGWEHRIETMGAAAGGVPVWVTETGLATYDKARRRVCREEEQAGALRAALDAPADRVYWYCLFDLPTERLAIEEANGGPREGAEYHMGLVRYESGFRIAGNEKPAFHELRDTLRPARSARSAGSTGSGKGSKAGREPDAVPTPASS